MALVAHGASNWGVCLVAWGPETGHWPDCPSGSQSWFPRE